MLAPLSWLKEYIDITLNPKELGDKLTEIGLGTEKITKTDNDVIFELEITPNRPDLLSIVGIAREIAAIEHKKIKLNIKDIPTPTKKLPFTIHNDFSLLEHYASVVISDITIKDSPVWLQKRLKQLGLRPINNIVDITNYVMFELGIPLHAFDYDEIHGHEFFVTKTKGGEKFLSVDKLYYSLPKDAIIIKDADRIVDLVGIKGGLNSGITKKTKNILLQTSSDNPALIRRCSQTLSLRSDASAILERGVDKNGMIPSLSRAVNLILDLAGGETASQVYDLKKESFEPWKLTLRISRLNKILGIEIDEKKIVNILASLNLNPHVILSERSESKDPLQSSKVIETTIPTYRNDLKIEEDLIEEVARIYGYNNFPKTLPIGETPVKKIPYFRDYQLDEKVKNILKASGFSEVYTYSLISEKDLVGNGINPQNTLRVDNPVSREFEYLRPTLKINLKKALQQNKAYAKQINLFELGKVYKGKSVNEASEKYFLSGITNSKNFFDVKGLLEYLFKELGISEDPASSINPIQDGIFFELNFSMLLGKINLKQKFAPLPKYPPIIEDLALIAPSAATTGEIIREIEKQSNLIKKVSLLDLFEDTRTFHLIYQHKERNLTTEEVGQVREKIIERLKEKFNVRLKE